MPWRLAMLATSRLATCLVLARLVAPWPATAEPAETPAMLPLRSHPAIEAYAARFAEPRWLPWLELMAARSAEFGTHIVEQLRRRGMPEELVLLPAIESEFRSDAVSNRGAAGLWQLMATTAGALGLVIDELRDERRDFWLATDAALTLLQQNLRLLGNWDLSIAAYNAGPGRIRDAMSLGGSNDFWKLRARGLLPRQTAEFVPRFYGLVLAARRLQLQLRQPPNGEWSRLPVPPGADVRVIARLADMPVEVLRAANAELRHSLTPDAPPATPYLLKVPERYRSAVAGVLASRSAELVRLHLYRIRSGDTLSELATAFSIPVSLLHRYNPGVEPRRLRVGLPLLLPVRDDIDPDAALARVRRLAQSAAPPPSQWAGRYRVRQGDSWWAIGRRHGTSPEQLAAANGMQANDLLHPETVLVVPATGGAHRAEA